jgi:hypothetical protein
MPGVSDARTTSADKGSRGSQVHADRDDPWTALQGVSRSKELGSASRCRHIVLRHGETVGRMQREGHPFVQRLHSTRDKNDLQHLRWEGLPAPGGNRIPRRDATGWGRRDFVLRFSLGTDVPTFIVAFPVPSGARVHGGDRMGPRKSVDISAHAAMIGARSGYAPK